MKHKDVTVLIYLHNNIDTIEACLNSVINMSKQVIKEIIVIDDGSMDSSPELLTSFSRIKIIKHEFLGIAKSINLQLTNIGDNDLVRINANVVIKTENWLEQLQNTAYENEEIGIVGVRLVSADNRIETDGRSFINGLGYAERFVNINEFKLNQGCKQQIIEVDSVSSALSYYKNDVVKRVGNFDENYFPLFTEDDDYCISARNKNFSVAANSFIQAFHFIPSNIQSDFSLTGDNEKIVTALTDSIRFIQEEHFKYWGKKWLWDLKYPDLDLIRKLYGSTKICWNIGEKLKFCSGEEFPSVDLCIVTWNNLSLLKRMMKSLTSTEYPKEKINVYITDNGSNDGTVEYLKDLNKEFIFKVHPEFLPINSGVVYGLNLAIIKGKGELVARLDDDIVLPFNWLKDLVKVMLKRPYCGMICPKVLNDNSFHSIQSADFVAFPSISAHENEVDTGQVDYLSKASNLRGSCNLYRRDVFYNCGLFDIRFSPSQYDDLDHQIAVLARGYEIIYNGYVNVIHKLNSGLDKSDDGLSSFRGNQLKLFGKWGIKIYEILDKSIELSYEGRKIDINKHVSYPLKAGEDINFSLNKDFCISAEGLINFKQKMQNDFNHFIESLLNNAINQFKSNSLIKALSILHITLNFDPSRISTILFLYIVYFRMGDVEMASHFKYLLGILNKKNIAKLNLQNAFYKDNYFNKVISHLNLNSGKSDLEEIMKQLIIEINLI